MRRTKSTLRVETCPQQWTGLSRTRSGSDVTGRGRGRLPINESMQSRHSSSRSSTSGGLLGTVPSMLRVPASASAGSPNSGGGGGGGAPAPQSIGRKRRGGPGSDCASAGECGRDHGHSSGALGRGSVGAQEQLLAGSFEGERALAGPSPPAFFSASPSHGHGRGLGHGVRIAPPSRAASGASLGARSLGIDRDQPDQLGQEDSPQPDHKRRRSESHGRLLADLAAGFGEVDSTDRRSDSGRMSGSGAASLQHHTGGVEADGARDRAESMPIASPASFAVRLWERDASGQGDPPREEAGDRTASDAAGRARGAAMGLGSCRRPSSVDGGMGTPSGTSSRSATVGKKESGCLPPRARDRSGSRGAQLERQLPAKGTSRRVGRGRTRAQTEVSAAGLAIVPEEGMDRDRAGTMTGPTARSRSATDLAIEAWGPGPVEALAGSDSSEGANAGGVQQLSSSSKSSEPAGFPPLPFGKKHGFEGVHVTSGAHHMKSFSVVGPPSRGLRISMPLAKAAGGSSASIDSDLTPAIGSMPAVTPAAADGYQDGSDASSGAASRSRWAMEAGRQSGQRRDGGTAGSMADGTDDAIPMSSPVSMRGAGLRSGMREGFSCEEGMPAPDAPRGLVGTGLAFAHSGGSAAGGQVMVRFQSSQARIAGHDGAEQAEEVLEASRARSPASAVPGLSRAHSPVAAAGPGVQVEMDSDDDMTCLNNSSHSNDEVVERGPKKDVGGAVLEPDDARIPMGGRASLPVLPEEWCSADVRQCLCISPETLVSELDKQVDLARSALRAGKAVPMRRVIVFDCRFGYEYMGGHISGALHCDHPGVVEDLLFGEAAPMPEGTKDGAPTAASSSTDCPAISSGAATASGASNSSSNSRPGSALSSSSSSTSSSVVSGLLDDPHAAAH